MTKAYFFYALLFLVCGPLTRRLRRAPAHADGKVSVFRTAIVAGQKEVWDAEESMRPLRATKRYETVPVVVGQEICRLARLRTAPNSKTRN